MKLLREGRDAAELVRRNVSSDCDAPRRKPGRVTVYRGKLEEDTLERLVSRLGLEPSTLALKGLLKLLVSTETE